MVLSARNPQLARLRRLARDRGERAREGAFVVEGPGLVAEAVAAGVELEVVYAAVGDRPPIDAELEANLRRVGVAVVEVAPEALQRAASTVTPQPVLGIARRPATGLPAAIAAARRAGLALVLVDVADPGNAGTLLRSAEAAGAGAVVFCGPGAVDPYNPKCVRASAGAIFPMTVAVAPGDPSTVLSALADAGIHRLATAVRGGEPYDQLDLREPVALVLGNEAHGLPPALLDEVDWKVTIPMIGRAESLNVAMAGTVLCFEVLRQRRAAAVARSVSGKGG